MLRKANQKRSLDNIVIQQGEFDWRSLLIDDEAFGKALGEFEDKEDAYAARVAAREEAVKEVEDRADFAAEADDGPTLETEISAAAAPEEETEEEGTVADYMLAFVTREWDWFSTWRL
jgi:helicase SRCAP/SWR1